ncbi:MAG: extracellular solute-binding protein [Ruminococcaceae bacterium]|nr:extracellular solute-binding protein [Oscillospiraceae bacterium]
MKKLFFTLVVVLVALAMQGCHGSREQNEFEIPQEFDSAKNYEITFWAKNDTNINQVRIYEKAISDFEALYPNIKVNLRLYTDYGRIYNDVITNMSTGTTPNVCITYPDHIATYLTGDNVVVPLDTLLVHDKYGLGGSEVKFDSPAKDEIVSKFLNECSFDGNLYALPFMRSTEACYVNKTYVEKLGYILPETLTWDFVWEVSRAATEKDVNGNFAVNSQKVMLPFIYKSTDNMMIQMLAQKNAGYSTDRGEVLVFNDTVSMFLKTIAFNVKKGAFSTFKISGYPANFLNAGQCIFAIDSTAGATWMGSDAPLCDISEENLVQFETEVMMIPQFDPDNPCMISQGPSVCVFNKDDPQEVLASWLFTQYLLTNDVQISYSCTEGYVPVTLKAQKSDEYKMYLSQIGQDNNEHYELKIKAAQLLLDNTDNTFVTPVFNGSASLRDAAGQMIENVTKSIRRNQTVDDDYIEKLYEDMISLHHLDRIDTTGAPSGKADLGKLPVTSVALVFLLGAAWLFIAVYYVADILKSRKK